MACLICQHMVLDSQGSHWKRPIEFPDNYLTFPDISRCFYLKQKWVNYIMINSLFYLTMLIRRPHGQFIAYETAKSTLPPILFISLTDTQNFLWSNFHFSLTRQFHDSGKNWIFLTSPDEWESWLLIYPFLNCTCNKFDHLFIIAGCVTNHETSSPVSIIEAVTQSLLPAANKDTGTGLCYSTGQQIIENSGYSQVGVPKSFFTSMWSIL